MTIELQLKNPGTPVKDVVFSIPCPAQFEVEEKKSKVSITERDAIRQFFFEKYINYSKLKRLNILNYSVQG